MNQITEKALLANKFQKVNHPNAIIYEREGFRIRKIDEGWMNDMVGFDKECVINPYKTLNEIQDAFGFFVMEKEKNNLWQ